MLQRVQIQDTGGAPSPSSVDNAVETWNGTAPPGGYTQMSTELVGSSGRRLTGWFSFLGSLFGAVVAFVAAPIIGVFAAAVIPIVLSGVGALFDGAPMGQVSQQLTLCPSMPLSLVCPEALRGHRANSMHASLSP